MSAIITNKFRKESAQRFVEDLKSSDYYIGLGKTDPWSANEIADVDVEPYGNGSSTVPLPTGTLAEEQDVKDNLIKLVRASTESTLLSPKNRWNSDLIYKQYRINDLMIHELESINNVTDLYPTIVRYHNNVYVCLSNNNVSIVTEAPTRNTYGLETTADGYIWAFIQTIDSTSNFHDEEFIPVNDDLLDVTNAKAETGGLVYAFDVEAGGSALNADTVIAIKLRGVDETGSVIADVDIKTDARFDVTIEGGIITKISYIDIVNEANKLLGYNKASIEVFVAGVLNSNIKIIPAIAPLNGFGASPKNDLPAYYAGCSGTFESTPDDTLLNIPFRQVSLIKNPSFNSGNVEFTALNYIELGNDPSAGIETGDIFRQEDTGARAFVDIYDTSNNRLYYHQNSDNRVNHISFETKKALTIERPTPIEIVYTNVDEIKTDIEYVHNTGDVLFVDNRTRIFRKEDQTENVKMVILF